jgi:nucleoid DNA-binding protein
MTKSELTAKLARHYPQLVAEDAEFAVNAILEAMIASLVNGHHRTRYLFSFG